MANSKYEYVKSFELEDEVMFPNLIVVRIDGRDFSRFAQVHEFEKPNDEAALNLMNSCSAAVLEEYPDIILAYGYSDEYSFVFKKTSRFYQRRASVCNKMERVLSSKKIKRRRMDGGGEGETNDDAVEGSGDNGNNNDGVKVDQYANSSCGSCMYGCKAKAMPLTKYCQLHILKDSKQKLYTGCTNVIKRAPAGPLLCGKPTLASTVPALCNVHFQKSQKLVAKALKDAGHSVSSASKPPPKLHVIVAAFVHHIQTKRKNPRSEGKLKSVVKEENTS